ncbi:MAG: glycine cleavage system aminomethyltransferase GcvT [Gemmataceae bacterium]
MPLRTPLYDWHHAKGGTLVEFGGWMLPVRYSTITDEHAAVRAAAGLFDISHMGRLSFGGPGALDLIQHVYTNDAATMKDGQVRYGLVCNAAGGIRDDVLVYRWPYGWAMVVNASNRTKIVAHLHEHLAGRDVQMQDQTESTCMLASQGPKAVGQARGMFDADPASLKYYHAAPTQYRGVPCVVSRTGYTGEDGLEVMIRADRAAALADDFVARGAKPCGLGARDTLRLEAAMPLYGHELGEETDPLQAGLGWAVKMDKGDFVGRDAILARQKDASRPVRVGLMLEGRRAAREGAVVLSGGKPVGKVTSGTIPPTVGRPIAMAYVEPGSAAVGTGVEVALGNASAAGSVVSLPFYRRA